MVISSIIQWYYFGAESALIAIESDYHKYKHFVQDGESTPPPGWSRNKHPVYDTFCYVPLYAPGSWFRFPVPLVDPSCSEIPMPTPISNRIACQTERAYHYITALSTDRRGRTYSLILDAEESYSGIMPLTRNALESCFRTSEADVEPRIELIAISTGSIEESDGHYVGSFQEYSRPEHRNVDGIYEFYNVLWIEWTDGVAYRKGLGRVTKAAWEAADREIIDVILE